MIDFFKLIYFILVFKAILRCVYFWQLKEYRLDRFREFLTTSESGAYFLPTNRLLRPKFTLKVWLLIYLAFYFTLSLLNAFPQNRLWAAMLAYLLLPVSVAVSVALLAPATSLVYDLAIFLAKIKIHLTGSRLTVVGITGSYGKTATKEILAHLLAGRYRVLKTPANVNTAVGVAKTVLTRLSPSHQVFVVEMGAYRRGEIQKICRLVTPQIGVLTGINQQHLGLFGSFSNLLATKYELIASLPKNGLAVVNGANKFCRDLAKKTNHVPVRLYSKPKKAFKTNLLGSWQQLNIAAAVTVARRFKVKPAAIKKLLFSIPSFKTALKVRRGEKGLTILDDSYNSNPAGFLAAVNFAKAKKARAKILVTAGIIETGSAKKDIHEKLAHKSLSVFKQVTVTKKDTYRLFLAAAKKDQTKKLSFAPDFNQIIVSLKNQANPQSLVLFEGRFPEKLIASL